MDLSPVAAGAPSITVRARLILARISAPSALQVVPSPFPEAVQGRRHVTRYLRGRTLAHGFCPFRLCSIRSQNRSTNARVTRLARMFTPGHAVRVPSMTTLIVSLRFRRQSAKVIIARVLNGRNSPARTIIVQQSEAKR